MFLNVWHGGFFPKTIPKNDMYRNDTFPILHFISIFVCSINSFSSLCPNPTKKPEFRKKKFKKKYRTFSCAKFK